MYVHQCFSQPCSTASISARVVLLLFSSDGSWLVAMCRDIGTALSLAFLALHDWASTVNCVPAGAADLSAPGHDNLSKYQVSFKTQRVPADHSKYRILFKSLRVRRTTTSSPHSLVQHLAGSLLSLPHLPAESDALLRPGEEEAHSFTSLHADGGVLYSPLDAFAPGLSALRRGRVRRTRGFGW